MSTTRITSLQDQKTALCLACSSSLPPVKPGLQSTSPSTEQFITRCCQRPICPRCISLNPRLARYDPCLACLGGVAVISARTERSKGDKSEMPKNVDGAVRDEDTFVVGDDEDSGDEIPEPPPPYILPSPKSETPSFPPTSPSETVSAEDRVTKVQNKLVDNDVPAPLRYHIKRGDTLQGIALRLGVNGRELCRLNKLPASTLTTTPHILHTRIYLVLPPSVQGNLENSQAHLDTDEDKAREIRRARERAEKRFQTLTKEVDWRIAKAYVALADDPDEADNYASKMKEQSSASNDSSAAEPSRLEMAAVNRYLEDNEWEAREALDVTPGKTSEGELLLAVEDRTVMSSLLRNPEREFMQRA